MERLDVWHRGGRLGMVFRFVAHRKEFQAPRVPGLQVRGSHAGIVSRVLTSIGEEGSC